MINTEILDSWNDTEVAIEKAAKLLQSGEVIGFPTETVYGLGAAIFNINAIENLFKIKNRPFQNPLSAHISSIEHVELLCDRIPDDFYKLAEKFLPGPLSIVLRKKSTVYNLITGGLETLSIRMPANEICRKLINKLGQPIAGTSANISGRPSSTTAQHVYDDFEGKIPLILDAGKSQFSVESTVLSLAEMDPIIIRPGAISQKSIEEVLNKKVYSADTQIMVFSANNKQSHYKSILPMKLFSTNEAIFDYILQFPEKKFLILSEIEYFDIDANYIQKVTDNSTFFENIRFAEKNGFSEIIILFNDKLQQNEVLKHRIESALK